MFARFPNFWTPVLPLQALTANPVGVELAGEKIVLFQDADGQWHALIDRCPHRGAALSLGTVTTEGHLRCGYHGWRFDGRGHCLAMPLNDLKDSAVEKVRAARLPVRIIGGAIWVFTATDPARADAIPEPRVPTSLEHDPALYSARHMEWNAHWTRAFENFLDFAHPPYLHRQTIGGWMHDYAEGGGISRLELEDNEFGMKMLCFEENQPRGVRLDWYRPNLSVLHLGRKERDKFHIFCVPVTEQRTRVMTFRAVGSQQELAEFDSGARGMGMRVLDEDRVIVESQSGDVLSDPDEISVPLDAPSVRFRRWYRSIIEQAA